MIESKKEVRLEDMDGIIDILDVTEELVLSRYFVMGNKVYDSCLLEVGYAVEHGFAYDRSVGFDFCLGRVQPLR